jgi:uncharacterized membrane protein (DUF2068 family)
MRRSGKPPSTPDSFAPEMSAAQWARSGSYSAVPIAKQTNTSRHSRAGGTGLLLIGIFKLIKAAALLAVGLGALTLLHKDVAETVLGWVAALKVDPANRYVASLMPRLQLINDRRLEEISAGTLVYAGLFSIEGVGLVLRRRWAEYFTAIATGLFIPLELYELLEHPSVVKFMVIAVNAAIVWYLIAGLRRREAGE